jgi:hypothetical protein
MGRCRSIAIRNKAGVKELAVGTRLALVVLIHLDQAVNFDPLSRVLKNDVLPTPNFTFNRAVICMKEIMNTDRF